MVLGIYLNSPNSDQESPMIIEDEIDLLTLSTAPKTIWKRSLKISELSPEFELSIPTFPYPTKGECSQSSLGLLNVPCLESISMSRITSAEGEGKEDPFGYSDILSSFPSTRRPSVIGIDIDLDMWQCPPSPMLRPTSCLRDSIDDLYLSTYSRTPIDMDMEEDNDDDYTSESSFGHSPCSHLHSDRIPVFESPISDVGSESSLEELIITPFSEILNLPHHRHYIQESHPSQSEDVEGEGYPQPRFGSGSYPASPECIGLGINFGSPSPSTTLSGPGPRRETLLEDVSMPMPAPVTIRCKSIDWSTFRINLLSNSDDTSRTSNVEEGTIDIYMSDRSGGLQSSPISYDSPLCRN
ncbi:hypothetical protein L486_06462 [Kwoniella mangroviensis CBS 10435]|uniref:Uncharacterized protein n=1 Tax=Kwoniella mangroviensis CBS 10435 TaxID=1331196 RepID=A0A1B9IJZ6_9TREE|nr:hypothetical protein L486_06462 [Kwoniella mangroviensis CBS 10435]